MRQSPYLKSYVFRLEAVDNNVEMCCCSVCAVDNADLNMNLKYPFNTQIVNQTLIIH